jgi:hypothetical protein
MKWLERRVRKKVGMLAVKIEEWEVKCGTEYLNCEDIQAETDDRNGEQNETDKAE